MDKSILKTAHDAAQGLHDLGLVNKQTMREFDELCLPEVQLFSANQIKKIREESNLSQAVFARFMNTSVETVKKWEAKGGTRKQPGGSAMQLINLFSRFGAGIFSKDYEDIELCGQNPMMNATSRGERGTKVIISNKARKSKTKEAPKSKTA
jgi:putative transcriptional regulator